MTRPRTSSASTGSSIPPATNDQQELGSMYDYLAKIILLGPSGSGKSCLLHRFVKNEWRVLSSQTLGVEFSSKTLRIGTGPRRKRIKLQLWDTAGTERFRSVSRSYYRGAAGALLVYDAMNIQSFTALPTFLADARALASPSLVVVMVGNKADLGGEDGAGAENHDSTSPGWATGTGAGEGRRIDRSKGRGGRDRDRDRDRDGHHLLSTSASTTSTLNSIASTTTTSTIQPPSTPIQSSTPPSASTLALTPQSAPTPVPPPDVQTFAQAHSIPATLSVSALTGHNVEEAFHRLARMILTRIELGEIDPEDPACGVQYGDYFEEEDDDMGMSNGRDGGDGGIRWRRGRRKSGAKGFLGVNLGLGRSSGGGSAAGAARRKGCC